MYLVGSDHRNKRRSIEILDRLIREQEAMVTSVEIYQEILHRYTAINRRDAIGPAFESLRGLTDDVLTFGMAEINRARSLLETLQDLSARDALHVASCRVPASIGLSFDSGFDSCPGMERVS